MKWKLAVKANCQRDSCSAVTATGQSSGNVFFFVVQVLRLAAVEGFPAPVDKGVRLLLAAGEEHEVDAQPGKIRGSACHGASALHLHDCGATADGRHRAL